MSAFKITVRRDDSMTIDAGMNQITEEQAVAAAVRSFGGEGNNVEVISVEEVPTTAAPAPDPLAAL